MSEDVHRGISAVERTELRAGPGAGAVRHGAAAVLAGVVFGSVTSMANVFGSAYGPFTTVLGEGVAWLEFVSKLLDSLWAWALFPFMVGWFVRRPVASVLAGTVGMLAADVAYYASDAALGMTGGLEVNAIRLWALVALVGAPVTALTGSLARGRNLMSLIAGLAAPAVMTYVIVERPAGSSEVGVWADRTVLVLAGLAAAGLLMRYGRSRPVTQS